MQTLGLHIDRPFLKAALLQKKRSGFKICALESSSLEEPGHVKLLYNSKFKGRLASGLSSKDLMLRSMELNIGNTKHVEAALAFQSEGTTHLNPIDTILVPHSIKKTGGKVEALLFTASREALRAHLEEFKKLHLDLDCIGSTGLALIHYVRWRAPNLSDAFLVDLGSSEWTCVWMENGQLKKSYSIGSGTEGLLAALWEDRKKILLPKEVEEIAKQIDLQQIKPNLNPHLSSKLSEIRQDLGKAILSFHRIANQRPIVFTGQIEAFGHLRDFLKKSFQEAVSEEHDELNLEERKFAIPIGLALEQSDHPLQLLKEEFFPRKNWRRAGCYALNLFLLSLALSFLLLVLGLHIIDNRKKNDDPIGPSHG